MSPCPRKLPIPPIHLFTRSVDRDFLSSCELGSGEESRHVPAALETSSPGGGGQTTTKNI